MDTKNRLCPQMTVIVHDYCKPAEILVSAQWVEFWPPSDCKTVYPGSIPGVASTFPAPQLRVGKPASLVKVAAPQRQRRRA
jgi:hypothetical protein